MNEPAIPDEMEVEVFRAGDYGPRGRYDGADLDAIARDYETGVHEAPVTIDHRQDGPADGWVRRLRRIGDRLVATLGKLSPRLRAALAAGAYRKRSIELYRRLPATGRPYLKAVSFLGAAAPEVKGLADPAFRDDAGDAVARFEEAPSPSPADREAAANAARERLVDARRWNPAWDEAGLVDAFGEIGPGATLDAVVESLRLGGPAATFGETPRCDDDAQLAGFIGSPSPDSVRRHRNALAYQAQYPTVSYAEALLLTASR